MKPLYAHQRSKNGYWFWSETEDQILASSHKPDAEIATMLKGSKRAVALRAHQLSLSSRNFVQNEFVHDLAETIRAFESGRPL